MTLTLIYALFIGISPTVPHSKLTLVLFRWQEELKHYDNKSLLKSCETLAFLVRDTAHVTPHNFESCVHTIRTFVEASINGGERLLLFILIM